MVIWTKVASAKRRKPSTYNILVVEDSPADGLIVQECLKSCDHSAAAAGVNFSIYGMLVRAAVPIPTRTEITIRVDDLEVSRKAIVRHCRQVQSWFQVGLKF